MKDIFGRDRTVKSSGTIASSENAIITAGGTQALVQQVNCDYSQEIATVTEVGKPDVYWIPGKAHGSINIAKLVGNEFFEGWKDTANCGQIKDLAVSVSGGQCGYEGNGTVDFDGAMLESVNFSITAQQMQINNGCKIRIAVLK